MQRRNWAGNRTQCPVMFWEELAISDLPETYHRKSKELEFLSISGELCVYLELPIFCLLPRICIISCHLLKLAQFSDTLLLKFQFFFSCPFIMSPTPSQSHPEILSFAFTEHMWTALTCSCASQQFPQ